MIHKGTDHSMTKMSTTEMSTRSLKKVSVRQMNILYLAFILSACGDGTTTDSNEASAPQIAAASPIASELTDIPTSVVNASSSQTITTSAATGLPSIDASEIEPEPSSPILITENSDLDVDVDGSVESAVITEAEVIEILAGSVEESEQNPESVSESNEQLAIDESGNALNPTEGDVFVEIETSDSSEQPNIESQESEASAEVDQTEIAGIKEPAAEEVDSDSSGASGNESSAGTLADDISFNKFRQNTTLPSRYRSMFGCSGTIEDRWMDLADSWPNTWNVSSRSEFDTAIANMDDGDRILIENGTSLGTVELSSSGSPDAKKYIMGKSSCDDVEGPDTFSTKTRFEISGEDWVLMNMKFQESGSSRAFGITGARIWIYNNRVEDAGEVKITPQGPPEAPTTKGIRIIGNYFNGRSGQAGVRMINPFGRLDTSSVYDLVIGGNTFENYVEPSYGPKVITDVTFGWNYPYGSETDLPGAETFTELGWNHFIDCHGEVPTSKSRRWMIHNNLFESTPDYRGLDPTHISLRGGDDKLVFRNIILDGSSRLSQKGLQINGARSQGYYNVVYRNDNGGIGFTWTTTETFPHYPYPDKTFFRNERLEDIDWRYNFFLGDGGDTASWLRFGTLGSKSKVSLPPTRNTVKDNFYSAEDPDRIVLAIKDDTHGLRESDWDANNPNAVRAMQHFGFRSGDLSTLDGSVTVPGSVTIKNFWLDNSDVKIDLPPWIGTASDDLINVIDE